jgi:hypothetical protein
VIGGTTSRGRGQASRDPPVPTFFGGVTSTHCLHFEFFSRRVELQFQQLSASFSLCGGGLHVSGGSGTPRKGVEEDGGYYPQRETLASEYQQYLWATNPPCTLSFPTPKTSVQFHPREVGKLSNCFVTVTGISWLSADGGVGSWSCVLSSSADRKIRSSPRGCYARVLQWHLHVALVNCCIQKCHNPWKEKNSWVFWIRQWFWYTETPEDFSVSFNKT